MKAQILFLVAVVFSINAFAQTASELQAGYDIQTSYSAKVSYLKAVAKHFGVVVVGTKKNDPVKGVYVAPSNSHYKEEGEFFTSPDTTNFIYKGKEATFADFYAAIISKRDLKAEAKAKKAEADNFKKIERERKKAEKEAAKAAKAEKVEK